MTSHTPPASPAPPPSPGLLTSPGPPAVPRTRYIVDAHEDIAWNWLDLGRHPVESALASREREALTIPEAVGLRTTGLLEWLAARVAIIFATLFVMPRRHVKSGWQRQTYSDADEAHAKAAYQLQQYERLADSEPAFRLVTTRGDLDQVLATWASPRPSDPVIGLVMMMEGADPIREPAEVPDWYARGLRIVGPAWAGTRYAGGTGEPGPLTPLGERLLAEMAGVDMILDLSHLAERAYLEALEIYPGALIASHSNPRKFGPFDRSLSDEMIRGLAARDGVVGIVPVNKFLRPGWRIGDPREQVSIHTVAEAVDYVAQLTGSSAHVGLGTDFDGGFGAESIPIEMDTIADLPLIAEALSARGYDTADIDHIMHGNWLRILRSSLP